MVLDASKLVNLRLGERRDKFVIMFCSAWKIKPADVGYCDGVMQGSMESFQTERIAAVLREKERSGSTVVLKVDPYHKIIDDID